MRPRYVINKGIQKNITAIGRVFVPSVDYTASIYNPKDTSKKIVATAKCYEEKERNTLHFMFTSEQTALLKVGYATLEIYDNLNFRMVYRENFALIRENSLPITPAAPQDEPTTTLHFEEADAVQTLSIDSDVEGISLILRTGRPVKLYIKVYYNGELEQDAYTLTDNWPLINNHEFTFEDSIDDEVYYKKHTTEAHTSVSKMEAWIEYADEEEENTPVDIDVFVPSESES